ncbi:DUF2868 domain-containing protein [Nitrosomonas sp. Is37]|uniref:DUF2868 domain-containing protein n=1 Tax=Nitrosomonas sp. Is37 TaxID=3080535 RepID=UPI00294ADE13|nr:DUF2868 domain-containing protein [Nitrosomonas sp. Is37]MDV6343748.1 DUF2868 domain-containing protein [Nitrosomonas sp. Is37]
MTINNTTFSDLVRLEQLRHIETSKAEALSYASIADMESHAASNFNYTVFLKRLTSRARRLIQDNALATTLQHPQKLFIRASRISLMVAAILGALAAGNAVGESSTLNIYWLLAVLLGFNLISIMLWMAGISFNLQGLSAGVVAQLTCWLPYRHKEKESDSIASLAARGWWETNLTGTVGKWRISVLTHQFWLTYLATGLVLLVLLMMAKQYDFIWGTTLLPESSFPELTQWLSKPMEFLGLIPPDSYQIAASRVGAVFQDAETRGAWAKFLLGALLLYGILPRLILLLVSVMMQKLAEHRFKLDLYLPYYITLRQRLMAHEFESIVIDADPNIVIEKKITPRQAGQGIPQNALAIGIELDDHIVWPNGMNCSKNVIDQTSFSEATNIIKKSDSALLIGVAAHRLPDRGVQRTIRELITYTSGEVWLILLRSRAAIPVADTRKIAWFRTAEACAISAECVITQ